MTYRRGQVLAAYLTLSHPTGEKSAKTSASSDGLLIVDYGTSGLIVSGQHHVSKFHLSAFCDPAAAGAPDPWLWVGSTADDSVKRRWLLGNQEFPSAE